jgi:(E)-4-hydroxy-3-methylbut-2-enyl-diphosphate synthase
VTAGLDGLEVPLRVAVMGCVVNGPGEAREADLGVASGNGKGQIFVKGKIIATVPESQIVETLIDQAMRLAEGAAPEPVDAAAPGEGAPGEGASGEGARGGGAPGEGARAEGALQWN